MMKIIAGFLIGFTPCKTNQPVPGMELQEEEDIKEGEHMGKLIIKRSKT